ncbi:MAG: hypothetical protein WB014_06140 [Methanosarcina sp.]
MEKNFAKAFHSALPLEREIGVVSKSFCATLPGCAVDHEKVAKAFCATLPSEAEVQKKLSAILENQGEDEQKQ